MALLATGALGVLLAGLGSTGLIDPDGPDLPSAVALVLGLAALGPFAFTLARRRRLLRRAARS